MGNGRPWAVEAEGVSKSFGSVTALVEVTLKVRRGCLFGLVGPNGAGKTTMIHILAGLLRPTRGSARVLGFDVTAQALEVKRRLGVVFDEPALYDHLTPQEFLRFVGEAYGLSRREIRLRTARLFELLTLEEKADALCRELSHGMRRKLELAAALLHEPRVLLLDEPLSGIDPIDAAVVKEVLRVQAKRGVTVILSSHVLDVLEPLCDEVGVLHRGRLVAQGDLDALRERVRLGRDDTLEAVFLKLVAAPTKDVRRLWEALPDAEE